MCVKVVVFNDLVLSLAAFFLEKRYPRQTDTLLRAQRLFRGAKAAKALLGPCDRERIRARACPRAEFERLFFLDHYCQQHIWRMFVSAKTQDTVDELELEGDRCKNRAVNASPVCSNRCLLIISFAVGHTRLFTLLR